MCSVEPSMTAILCSASVGAGLRHALALTAGLALGGCAGAGPSEEDEVRATLAAFGRAAAARDGRTLCDRLLARSLVEEVERSGLPCAVAMRTALRKVRDPQLVVGRVSVEGARARAEVRMSAGGQPPARDEVRLVKSEGRWRIVATRTLGDEERRG